MNTQEASDEDQVGERTELVEGSSDMDEATETSFREPIILRIPKARYVRNNTRNRSPSFSPTNPRASSTMRSESSLQERRPVSRLHQQGSKPPKKIAKMSTTRTGSSSTSHSKSVSICRSNQSSRASKRNKSKQDTSASSNQSSSMKEFCAFCADEVTPLDIKSKNGIVECSGHKVHKYCKPDCVKAHY